MAFTSETLSILGLIRGTGASVLRSALLRGQRNRLVSLSYGRDGARPVIRERAVAQCAAEALVKSPDRIAYELVRQSRYLPWIELTDALIERQRGELHGLGSFVFKDSYNAVVTFTPTSGLLRGDVPWVSEINSDELKYAVRAVFLALERVGLVHRGEGRSFAMNLPALLEGAKTWHTRWQSSNAEDAFLAAIATTVLQPLLQEIGVSTRQLFRLGRIEDAEAVKTSMAFAVYQATVIAFAATLQIEENVTIPLVGSFIVKQGRVVFEAHPAFIGMIASNQPQYA